jgi:hypothetical protein
MIRTTIGLTNFVTLFLSGFLALFGNAVNRLKISFSSLNCTGRVESFLDSIDTHASSIGCIIAFSSFVANIFFQIKKRRGTKDDS